MKTLIEVDCFNQTDIDAATTALHKLSLSPRILPQAEAGSDVADQLAQWLQYCLDNCDDSPEHNFGTEKPPLMLKALADYAELKANTASSAEAVAWIRRQSDGNLTHEFILDWNIEDVRKLSGSWEPLFLHPTSVAQTGEENLDISDADIFPPKALLKRDDWDSQTRKPKINLIHEQQPPQAQKAEGEAQYICADCLAPLKAGHICGCCESFGALQVVGTATNPPSGYVAIQKSVIDWLLGESDHPQYGWFKRPEGEGKYWWRTKLGAAILSGSPPAASAVPEWLDEPLNVGWYWLDRLDGEQPVIESVCIRPGHSYLALETNEFGRRDFLAVKKMRAKWSPVAAAPAQSAQGESE